MRALLASVSILSCLVALAPTSAVAGVVSASPQSERTRLKPIPKSSEGRGDVGIKPRALERLLERTVRSYDVPGIVARLVEPDGYATAAAGRRQRGATPAFEIGDQVHIGSCLKAFTATLVGQLVDEGRLTFSTTLADALPDLAGSMDPALLSVTIEELLAHRSGVTDDIPEDLLAQILAFEGTGREARAIFAPQVLALRPGGTRGDFSYSNIGYALVGFVIERVENAAFEDVLARRILQPLGMRSAIFGAPGSSDPRVIDAPRGHGADGVPLTPAQQSDPPILSPAGTFSMTLADWSKFAMIHSGRAVSGVTLVSAATLHRLHTPFGGEIPPEQGGGYYALGWGVIDTAGVTVLAHDGSNEAWLTRIMLNPATARVFLVSTNQASDSAIAALDNVTWQPAIVGWLLAP